MNDRGSILPIVAGYLALTLIAIFGASSVISTHLLAVRIQGIADAAVLFGHDQAQTNLLLDARMLNNAVKVFLREAISVRELQITRFSTNTSQAESSVIICGRWQDPFRRLQFSSLELCRDATARSFTF